jgi:hypothetical protein
MSINYVPPINRRGLCNVNDQWFDLIWFDLLCSTPLSAIFQLYQRPVLLVEEAEYREKTTDHGQATSQLFHLQLRVECTILCNLQSQALTHFVLVIWLLQSYNDVFSVIFSTFLFVTQLICSFGCENIHANQDLRTHRYSSPGTKKAVQNNVLFSFVSVAQWVR